MKTSRPSLLCRFILILWMTYVTFALEILSEDITVDRIISANILVQATVYVRNGATVTIQPGVTVYFDGYCGIHVYHGSLYAEGTSVQKIHFQSYSGEQYIGLFFYFTGGSVIDENWNYIAGSKLSYVEFDNKVMVGASVNSDHTALYLSNVLFGGGIYGIYSENQVQIYVKACTFNHVQYDSISMTGANVNLRIENSTFLTTTSDYNIEVAVTGDSSLYITTSSFEEPVVIQLERGKVELIDNRFKSLLTLSGGDEQVVDQCTWQEAYSVPQIMRVVSGLNSTSITNNIVTESSCQDQYCIQVESVSGSVVTVKDNSFTFSASANAFYFKAYCSSELTITSNTLNSVTAATLFTLEQFAYDCGANGYFTMNDIQTASVAWFFDISKSYDFTIHYNIFTTTPYAYYVYSESTIGKQDVSLNYWGTSDATIIRTNIYDALHKVNYAYVTFSPFYTTTNRHGPKDSENFLSHTIALDTTYSSDTPITGIKIIGEGTTLTITDGAVITFRGSDPGGFVVLGSLKILSEPETPVTFVKEYPSTSVGIAFKNTAVLYPENQLSYLSINGDIPISVQLNSGTLWLSNVKIDGSTISVSRSLLASELIMTDCPSVCVTGEILDISSSSIQASGFNIISATGSNSTVVLRSSRIDGSQSFSAKFVSISGTEFLTPLYLSNFVELSLTDNNIFHGEVKIYHSRAGVPAIVSGNRFESYSGLEVQTGDWCLDDRSTIIKGNSFMGSNTNVLFLRFAGSRSSDYNCHYRIEENSFMTSNVKVEGKMPLWIVGNSFNDPSLPVYVEFSSGLEEYTEYKVTLCDNNYWGGLTDKIAIHNKILDASRTVGLPMLCIVNTISTNPEFGERSSVLWPTDWSESSYDIELPYGVNIHAPVIVDAGVKIVLGENATMFINSTLVARGDEENHIVIQSATGRFGSIHFAPQSQIQTMEDYYSSGSFLSYVDIMNGGANGDAALVVENGYMALSNITITGSGEKSIVTSDSCITLSGSYINSGSVTIEQQSETPVSDFCIVYDNEFDTLSQFTIAISQQATSLQFQNNQIYGNSGSFDFDFIGEALQISDNVWTQGALNSVIKLRTGKASFVNNSLQSGAWAIAVEKVGNGALTISDNKMIGQTVSNDKDFITSIESVACGSIHIVRNEFAHQRISDNHFFSFNNSLSCSEILFQNNSVHNIDDMNGGSYPLIKVSSDGVVLRRNLFNDNIVQYYVELDNSAVTYLDARENWWSTEHETLIRGLLSVSQAKVAYQPYLLDNDFDAELSLIPYPSPTISSDVIEMSSLELSPSFRDVTYTSSPAEESSFPIQSATIHSESTVLISSGSQVESSPIFSSVQSSSNHMYSSAHSSSVDSSEFPSEETIQVSSSEGLSSGQYSSHHSSHDFSHHTSASLTESTSTSSEVDISSPLHVSSSTPEVVPTMSVYLQNNSDYCWTFKANAVIESSNSVENIHYKWTVFKNNGEFVQTAPDSANLELNMASHAPGIYLVQVQVTGFIRSTEMTANASIQISKPANRLGIGCTTRVSFATSFIENAVVNRNSKIWIIPSVSKLANIQFNWNVTLSMPGRGIRAVPADEYVITAPNGPALALYSPNGLPGDATVSILLSLHSLSRVAFQRKIQFKLSPSVPITKGAFEVSTDATEISGFDGYALSTKFSLTATGWRSGIDTIPLKYTFQYLDQKLKKNVTLISSENPSVSVLLPAGFGADFALQVSLIVANEWGDSVHTTKTLAVVPGNLDLKTLSVLSQSALGKNTTEFVTNAIAIASFVNQAVEKKLSNSADSNALYKKIVKTFLNRISDIIPEDDRESSELNVQQRIELVALLTKEIELVDQEDRQLSIELMNNVLNRYSADDNSSVPVMISTETASQVVEVISNVVGGGLSNSSISDVVTLTAKRLAHTLLDQSIVSERAISLNGDLFQLSVKLDTAGALSNSTITTSNGQLGVTNRVSIPQTFSQEITDDDSQIVSYIVLMYNKNPFSSQSNTSDDENVDRYIATPVMDLTFNHENGSKIDVQDLTVPITLQLSKPSTCDLVGDYSKFSCKYWDENEHIWKSDGCVWVKKTTTSKSVTCQCSHTTSFSAFILHKGKCPKKAPGMSITGIVFNSIYIVLCVGILTGLFVARDSQPLRSRFIAPYLGISAILVDAVLQGIVSNSLGLAEKWSAMDAFSYVIMLTANPLSVTALFVYVWQQVRFILLQNIYYLMRHKRGVPIVTRICRVITSKLLFVSSTVAVGAFVFVYFLVLVIVAATRKNGIQTDRVIAAQSTTYAGFIILLSISICVMLILDIFVSFKQSTDRTISETTHTGETIERKTLIGAITSHVTNDPLLFRAEACLILFALLLIVILYPIGIGTVFKDSAAKSGPSVTRYIIEILYMFASIAAFGGFVCVASLKHKFTRNLDLKQLAEDNSGDENIAFFSLLRDPEGLRILRDYCTKEFSLENVLFYEELEEIRASNLVMSEMERRATLERIHAMYIAENSERQLNCESKVVRSFNQTLKKETLTLVDTEDIYQKLHVAVIINLGDTFSRLTDTKEYKVYTRSKEIHVELQTSMELEKQQH